MMILLGNKQNSLILLGLFSFSRMEIPVYNLVECTPWDGNQALFKSGNLFRHSVVTLLEYISHHCKTFK